MRDLVNTDAVEVVTATVEHGASSDAARGGGASWCRRPMRPASDWTAADHPAHVAGGPARRRRQLSTSLRGGSSGCAGRRVNEQVTADRGLAVVGDSLIRPPSMRHWPPIRHRGKIRGGKVQAAGASSVR
jgi:aspartyl-tRNA(Asn)/glutamyl-tRNA(Gln) amidotransferase subunit B